MVPLTINCWPSVSGGESYVNIEYESTVAFDLQNVVITIPLPALAHAPRVTQVHLKTLIALKPSKRPVRWCPVANSLVEVHHHLFLPPSVVTSAIILLFTPHLIPLTHASVEVRPVWTKL